MAGISDLAQVRGCWSGSQIGHTRIALCFFPNSNYAHHFACDATPTGSHNPEDIGDGNGRTSTNSKVQAVVLTTSPTPSPSTNVKRAITKTAACRTASGKILAIRPLRPEDHPVSCVRSYGPRIAVTPAILNRAGDPLRARRYAIRFSWNQSAIRPQLSPSIGSKFPFTDDLEDSSQSSSRDLAWSNNSLRPCGADPVVCRDHASGRLARGDGGGCGACGE